MRLRTFNALDIYDAMNMIRETMGEDAVIISSSPDPMGNGVNVTVAAETLDDDLEPVKPPIVAKSLSADSENKAKTERKIADYSPLIAKKTIAQRGDPEAVLREIETIFRFHSLPDHLIRTLLETARHVKFDADTSLDGIRQALRKILDAAFQFSPLPVNHESFRLMLVGPPGIGKTMTIAKIAAQIVMDKKKVTVITTDNKRAGGVEQLSAFTSILGLDLQVAGSRSELRKTLQECPANSRVLIDTGGTNPYDMSELKELSEFMGVGEVEPVLAAPAGLDSNESEDITRAFGFLGISKILVTRADTARRFGSILAAAHSGNLAFSNVSSTGKVIGEFREVNAQYLAQLLIQHRQEQ